jgi:glutathione-regulated potassium-efflux system ancillary protein KefG
MPSRSRLLVLFAHPAIQKSRINRQLAAAARTVDGVTFNDLYEEYPDYQIEVTREQELLLTHDVIVFQHPFYWYSCPALLKEWLDLVLEYGFAYGPGGTRLNGKAWLSVITTGGSEPAYHREGHNRFTMRELLAPFEQTARLCGMRYLPPFLVHGTITITDAEEMERHAREYTRVLAALRDGRVDLNDLSKAERFNANLAAQRVRT